MPDPQRDERVDSGRWPIFELLAAGAEPDPDVHAEMGRRMAEVEERLKARRHEAGDAA